MLIAPEVAAPALVHIARPGWWFGDTALITQTPRRAALAARRDGWAMRLPRQTIGRMAAGDPTVWRRFAQITVGHLDHALSMIAGFMSSGSRARVALTLRRPVDLEGNVAQGSGTVRISHEDLGEMTRLHRNAIAQILAELEQAGVVRRRYRRIEVPDIAALACYLETRVTPTAARPQIG